MEMTEGFSRVNACFHEAANLALMNGRSPYRILFGPEEFTAWENMVKSQDHVYKGPMCWVNTTQIEANFFYGLPVRRMAHPGVAVLSV